MNVVSQHDSQNPRRNPETIRPIKNAQDIAEKAKLQALILVGDDPEPTRSDAALTKPCSICPIPASSGKMNQKRLNPGGNSQANAARFRAAVLRMRDGLEAKA